MSINKTRFKTVALASLVTTISFSPTSFAKNKEILSYPDGSQYIGELKDGKRHGRGTLRWSNGDQYEGQWENDLPHGLGTKTFIDKSIYEGEFYKGAQHGKGLFTYPDGTTYDGEWQQDTPNGLGVFVFKNSGTYEGTVYLGLPHGQGSFSYKNGDFYNGQWEHGKREGMGKIHYRNGSLYVGNFTLGKARGSGVMTYADGSRFKGTFIDGKPHGDGTCFKPNEQALCSYEQGKQVAYAVIPNYLAEETTTPQKPEPEIQLQAETPKQIKTQFVEALTKEKKQLKPAYTTADLNPGRSDILFNHNFESLELADALRTGTWKMRGSLFNDHLIINTRSGDLKLNLKINLFEGPGTYHVKAGDIKAWFNGKLLQGLKAFAHTITIRNIEENWLEGSINLSFQEKDNYGDYYKVENGVFRLNNDPIYNPITR